MKTESRVAMGRIGYFAVLHFANEILSKGGVGIYQGRIFGAPFYPERSAEKILRRKPRKDLSLGW